MNELFKLGRITEETMGVKNDSWIELVGTTATTSFSTNNSRVHV
jgi:hypothetical protein